MKRAESNCPSDLQSLSSPLPPEANLDEREEDRDHALEPRREEDDEEQALVEGEEKGWEGGESGLEGEAAASWAQELAGVHADR